MDRIILRRIPFNFVVGPDAWAREKPQPVYVSLEISHDVRASAAKDNVSLTLDYGKLYKSLTKDFVGPFLNVFQLVQQLRRLFVARNCLIEITMPKGNLRAEGGMHFTFDFEEGELVPAVILSQSLSIRGLRCACIVGVNPHERKEKQIVLVNLNFKRTDEVREDDLMQHLLSSSQAGGIPVENHADMVREVVGVGVPGITYILLSYVLLLTRRISQQVEGSSYQTVEALATVVARTVIINFGAPDVWVEIEKPNAIAAIEAAGVRIYRDKSFFTENNFWHVKHP